MKFPFALSLAAATGGAIADVDLDLIELPEGFRIEVVAEGLESARQMAWGDDGVLFVGSRKSDKVYAAVDSDGDGTMEKTYVVARDMKMPSGIAYRDGSLYIGDLGTIYRLDGIESRLDNPPAPVVVTDAFPDDRHHGWKYLAFGPDGKLYVPVGAPCNICLEPEYAAIKRMNPDGTEIEDYVLGVRNSVGFTWHPTSGELWFTDNGRDMLGDDIPPCELNRVQEPGTHYGYPFCHGNDIADPQYGEQASCDRFEPPAQELGPHVAPLGLAFYTGEQFPEPYHGRLFIAEHGSWNRSRKIGYRITMVTLDDAGNSVGYETFASGWLQGESNWGRPVDVLLDADGSMLISDDQAGVIYRISYDG